MPNLYAPEIYQALKPAVSDALAVIRATIASGGYIGTHFDYPTISQFPSGVTNLGTSYGNGPTDYRGALRAKPDLNIPKPSPPSWGEAVELLSQNRRLRDYYEWDEQPEEHPFSPQFMIEYLIGNLAERSIHETKRTDFSEETLRPIYTEWEASVFAQRLSFDVLVPIIFVDFDVDDESSESGTFNVIRLPKQLQLARGENLRNSFVGNRIVAGGASHALLLRDWEVENGTWSSTIKTLSSADAFSDVLPLIDRFYSALRVETGCSTGYSQIVLRPNGWAMRWTADLPSVHTFDVREYPDDFDSYGWLRSPATVTDEDTGAVLALCDALSAIKQNKLALACKRLNGSYLRRDEADSILDITIALETLLADDTTSELAYRLAMRIGGLAGRCGFGGYSPEQVFALCKKVYDYRSSVVHGARGSEKKRLIREAPEAEPVPAIAVGLTLLRHTIKALASQPEFLEVRALDSYLLRASVPPRSSGDASAGSE